MTIKRILIIAPTIVVIFLLQSYFWVPTYEQQTKGNPDRLVEYIDASIGDASLLNPILTADSASSQIEGMVYEGLIDRDEELRFRGRLATAWDVYEEAYFYVNESAVVPGLGQANAEQMVRFLKEAKQKRVWTDPDLVRSLANIKEISVVPQRDFEMVRSEKSVQAEGKGEEIRIQVQAPARIKLALEQVDQDLFENLKELLGGDYFSQVKGLFFEGFFI